VLKSRETLLLNEGFSLPCCDSNDAAHEALRSLKKPFDLIIRDDRFDAPANEARGSIGSANSSIRSHPPAPLRVTALADDETLRSGRKPLEVKAKPVSSRVLLESG
jgi:hypothetical protein